MSKKICVLYKRVAVYVEIAHTIEKKKSTRIAPVIVSRVSFFHRVHTPLFFVIIFVFRTQWAGSVTPRHTRLCCLCAPAATKKGFCDVSASPPPQDGGHLDDTCSFLFFLCVCVVSVFCRRRCYFPFVIIRCYLSGFRRFVFGAMTRRVSLTNRSAERPVSSPTFLYVSVPTRENIRDGLSHCRICICKTGLRYKKKRIWTAKMAPVWGKRGKSYRLFIWSESFHIWKVHFRVFSKMNKYEIRWAKIKGWSRR